MARKDDEFFRPRREDDDEAVPTRRSVAVTRADDDPAETEDELGRRVIDLDVEEESPFLRGQKRVPVRRGPLPKRAANRLKIAVIVLLVLGGACAVAGAFYAYGTNSWRFRIDSSDNLEIDGTQNVTRAQVMEVFGGDIGRNIFFVPLAERKKQLEDIPWVESATVMRLLPDHLKVAVRERTPVAFVRIGSKVSLIDASGVIMEMPAKPGHHYSFPVIVGMEDSEPLSTRAARMKTFMRMVKELDSGGARYSEALSEVDLSDPEDVKATIADAQGAVLVHLGDEQFLNRYKIYLAHVEEWRQQFKKLDSVDLRYDRQVIVNPDSSAGPAAQGAVPAANKKTSSRSGAVAKRH